MPSMDDAEYFSPLLTNSSEIIHAQHHNMATGSGTSEKDVVAGQFHLPERKRNAAGQSDCGGIPAT
jgi:hypothetical protein